MALDSDGNVQLQGKTLIKDFNFKEVTFRKRKRILHCTLLYMCTWYCSSESEKVSRVKLSPLF